MAMMKGNPMAEMEKEYDEGADMIQEEQDMALPKISGRFGKAALNGLVKAFNMALVAAGFPGDYPTFNEDQLVLPTDFVRGLMMMADAAVETEAGVELTLDGITDDRGLAMVAAKLQALAKSDAFKKAMQEEGGTEVEMEVSVKPEEDMFMERA